MAEGFDPAWLAAAQQGVQDGELAGAVALVWQRGRSPVVGAVGVRDLQTGEPAARDTIYRVASLTKPVTAFAALQLLDEGRFALDDPITAVVPELAGLRVLPRPDAPLAAAAPAERPLTYRDLLTHRAGLAYGDLLAGPVAEAYATLGPHLDNPLSPDAWIERLAAIPLLDPPGTAFRYGHASDLLGIVLSRLDDAPLADVLRRRVFDPLGMADTGFDFPPSEQHRCAGLSGFDADGRLIPLPQSPGGHAQAQRPATLSFQSGGQGLWSTVDDYARFAGALLGHGPRLLRPDTLRAMTSNQLTEAQRTAATLFGAPLFTGAGFGFGLAVVLDPAQADPLRCQGGVGTVGWPGAFGSWWQADPTTGTVRIFLTHAMADLPQMAEGIGLGGWSAIAGFHAASPA